MIWPRISAIGMALWALQCVYGMVSQTAYLLGRIQTPYLPSWAILFKSPYESDMPRYVYVKQDVDLVFIMFLAAVGVRFIVEKLWKRDEKFEGIAWMIAIGGCISSCVDILKLLSRMNDVLTGAIHLNFGSTFFMPIFGLGFLVLPILLNAIGLIGWAQDAKGDVTTSQMEKNINAALQNLK